MVGANTVWLTDEARVSIDGIEQVLVRVNNEMFETFSINLANPLGSLIAWASVGVVSAGHCTYLWLVTHSNLSLTR